MTWLATYDNVLVFLTVFISFIKELAEGAGGPSAKKTIIHNYFCSSSFILTHRSLFWKIFKLYPIITALLYIMHDIRQREKERDQVYGFIDHWFNIYNIILITWFPFFSFLTLVHTKSIICTFFKILIWLDVYSSVFIKEYYIFIIEILFISREWNQELSIKGQHLDINTFVRPHTHISTEKL